MQVFRVVGIAFCLFAMIENMGNPEMRENIFVWGACGIICAITGLVQSKMTAKKGECE